MALVWVSINVWRLAGDTLNITCNFLYCNHQMHRDFVITLYYSSCNTKQLLEAETKLICVIHLKYIVVFDWYLKLLCCVFLINTTGFPVQGIQVSVTINLWNFFTQNHTYDTWGSPNHMAQYFVILCTVTLYLWACSWTFRRHRDSSKHQEVHTQHHSCSCQGDWIIINYTWFT
jgi:hypothetical protein